MGECLQNSKFPPPPPPPPPPPEEYLLYSQVSGGKVYSTANIPKGNIYYIVNNQGGRFAMRMVYYTTPEHSMLQPHNNSFSCQKLAYL